MSALSQTLQNELLYGPFGIILYNLLICVMYVFAYSIYSLITYYLTSMIFSIKLTKDKTFAHDMDYIVLIISFIVANYVFFTIMFKKIPV